MDLERRPFPMGRSQSACRRASKPGRTFPPQMRRALFVSLKAEEQSQAMANAKLSLDQAVEDARKANSGYRADFREGQRRRKE